jgi:hypothetical protein
MTTKDFQAFTRLDASDVNTYLVNRTGSGNAVINGAFDFWQRGTTTNHTGSIIYGPDRWAIFRGGFAVGATSSRQPAGLTSFQFANRVQRASGNTLTATIIAIQPFESVSSIPFAGKKVTLSFFARRGANFSGATNSVVASITTGTGTDQTPWSGFTGFATAATGSRQLSLDWEQFFITGTVAASATQIAVDISYTPSGTAGANDWFEYTGVQLEEGSTPTPFRRNGNSIEGELAACQRYYNRYLATGSAFTRWGYADSLSTTEVVGYFYFPVEMRRIPTVDFLNVAFINFAGSAFGVTPSVSVVSNAKTVTVSGTGTGIPSGQFGAFGSNATTNSFIGFIAEIV